MWGEQKDSPRELPATSTAVLSLESITRFIFQKHSFHYSFFAFCSTFVTLFRKLDVVANSKKPTPNIETIYFLEINQKLKKMIYFCNYEFDKKTYRIH